MRPMVKFAKKLKILKGKLRVWAVFGNIHQDVKNAEDLVLTSELIFDQVLTDINKRQLAIATQELNRRLETEVELWRQKANIKWIKGERNTKLFHQTVKRRRDKVHIHRLRTQEGHWTTTEKEIKNEAIKVFQEQLNGNHISVGEELLQNRKSLH